ncbi:MAG: flagellar protein FlaG [Desulfobulbaceae bacterium]|nr:flagellar protein FlaG [Desulfobulbaceae bacterium]MCK5340330.1 flagellar protein FlaG [Desulfobulbaceae bacterium]MCK5404574.1 flagellar protein FlaG [Desulfobulbaceae bacterium]
MVDVNVSTDVKGYGVPAVPAVEVEDRVKPQVQPVQESSEAETTALDDKALHNRGGKGKKEAKHLSQEEIEEFAAEIQQHLDSIGSTLSLGLSQHQQTDSIIVRVTERTSGDLVRQFPSEEILELKKKLNDLVGFLYDKKA